MCPWAGPRDQHSDHLKLCPYEQIRPDLETLQTKCMHLEQVVNDQNQSISNLNEQCQAQQKQIDELTATVKSLKGMLI